MSEPAKDEVELLKRVAKAACCVGACVGLNCGDCCAETYESLARDIIAIIRAAGWAVVPQTKLDCLRADNALLLASFMEKAAEELEKVYDMYCSNHHQYERDMELPRAIRAMLAATPGMEP